MEQRNYIKAGYVFSAEKQKLRLRKPLVISAILFAVGVLGLLAYVIWGTVWETKYDYTPAACNALLACAVPFVIGLTLMLTIRTAIKNVKNREGTEKRYEFYNDIFVVYETRGGEVGSAKFAYEQVYKAVWKDDLLYIYCMGGAILHIAEVAALEECERNTLKKLFREQIDEGAPLCSLQNFGNIA